MLNEVMETEISDNILGVLWSKLTYTCLGYYGSLADASLMTSCADTATRHNLAEFFAEVVAVGTAVGRALDFACGIQSTGLSSRHCLRQTACRGQSIRQFMEGR